MICGGRWGRDGDENAAIAGKKRRVQERGPVREPAIISAWRALSSSKKCIFPRAAEFYFVSRVTAISIFYSILHFLRKRIMGCTSVSFPVPWILAATVLINLF